MILALLACVLAAGIGGALGLLPRAGKGALRPIRTFAFVAALAIVLGHLMPEALDALGWRSLVVFGVSFLLAVGLDRLTHDHSAGTHDFAASKVPLAVELGFVALAIHRFIDGIAFAHYADRPAILAAFAAHSVPVTALVVVTYRGQSTRAAVTRGLLLTLACALGVVFHDSMPHPGPAAEGWICAIVSGLLLHVVTHGWHDDTASTARGWALELVAVAAGVAFLFMAETHVHFPTAGQDDHEGHEHAAHAGDAHDHDASARTPRAHVPHMGEDLRRIAPYLLLATVAGFGFFRSRRRNRPVPPTPLDAHE